MIQGSIRDFATEVLRPGARDWEEGKMIPNEVIQQAWDLGIITNQVPEAYGGYGADRSILTGTVVTEELAWGDLAFALAMLAPALVAFPILDLGTAKQKEAYLPLFARSSYPRATGACMEPDSFFDPRAPKTIATKDGEGFVLKGTKCLVPAAGEAELFLIQASMDGGLGWFIVEREQDGFSVSDQEKNMGIQALDTRTVKLDGCRLAPGALLGAGEGDPSRIMDASRVALASMAVGVARAAYEYALDYAKEREAWGEPIASRQAIAFMLANMAIEIDGSRLLTWEAAVKMDKREEATKEAAMVKRYAAEMALRVADGAVQVLGGHGYIREHPVELWLRNSRLFAMVEGMAMI